MNISVIICCYNSEFKIQTVLEHLNNQNTDLYWEVVLVDNNCTDNTVEVASNIWKSYGSNIPLRVLIENKPGLSYARKSGVLSSLGEILIFCDDDNWLTEDYLEIAYNVMFNNPKIGACCGENYVATKGELPAWFEDYKGWYACGRPSGVSDLDGKIVSAWGAGMVIRSGLLKQLYSNSIVSLISDRIGNNLSSSGDDEMCFWIKMCGYDIYYVSGLKLVHYMPPNRLTIDYRDKLVQGICQSLNNLRPKLKIIYKAFNPVAKSDFIWLFYPGIRGVIARLKFGLGFIDNYHLHNNYKALKHFRNLNFRDDDFLPTD